MDREELELKLNNDFKNGCTIKGYPIKEICLEDAYPGDDSTSFVLNVSAEWVVNMDCSSALDILIDVLWETTEIKHREAIFAINIFSDEETLHCQSIDNINEAMRNSSAVNS
jgi:hypothetical protein